MYVSGIIAEYNPFHKGHKYHMDKTREFSSHIIVALDGHFMQRGDISICSKWARTEMALENGGDLVVEIPAVFSLAPAMRFAVGGVETLSALGLVDCLSFGSESGEIDLLQKAAEAAASPMIKEQLDKELAKGKTFARAREDAVALVFSPEIAAVFKTPNNNLAIEYINALRSTESSIAPVTIKRYGADHDSAQDHETVSASFVRHLISMRGIENVKEYLPFKSYEILRREESLHLCPSLLSSLEKTLLGILRQKSLEELKNLPDVSEGIENRLYAAIRASSSLEELYAAIKTKRYPLSRIRRLILTAVLGFSRDLYRHSPGYIRVLGFNEKGRELLHQARKTATLPIIMKTAQIEKAGPAAQEIFTAECAATDLYNLSLPAVQKCGTEMTNNSIRTKSRKDYKP
ncbi:MAG: hypothetical protein BGN88_15535 [Clostridiales bacterium 43-6]|nr:MAG: hypothetical protein BGN88_15535 [Clostridiales bacterium 43-6]